MKKEMADVKVISSSIVRPGNIDQTGRPKIHLTPSDLNLLFLEYPQRGLLFPKPDPETGFISRVKTSLSTALEIYFPFAGRLVKVDNHEENTVSFYIDCDDSSGAIFVHAIAESVSVSDLLQPDGSIPDFLRCFFPMNGTKSIHGIAEPLLALQVTEMKDGVFISFGYNHMVADGTSIWNFFNTWSKICSNDSGSDLQPLLLRGWFLEGIDYPIHIPASEMEAPRAPSPELSSSVPIMEERVFHFTRKKISDLKAKANSQISSSDLKISSLQAVVAHVWRSSIRHSGLNQEEESHCRVAADMRQRLNPPLEKECFGNVAYLGIATATVEELQAHGLGGTALKISKMVRSLNNEDYKTYAEKWVRNVKIPKFSVGCEIVSSASMAVAGSPRFQVYNTDFGWGKPIAARAGPRNNSGGCILVLFSGVEEGSIDVHATLWSHVLIKLLNDVEFMDA